MDTFTIGATQFDCFKLDRRARCKAFGMERYAALKKTTFYRCEPCGTVLASRKPAARHKCSDQGGRARRGHATGLLPGGVQLNVAIPRVSCHVMDIDRAVVEYAKHLIPVSLGHCLLMPYDVIDGLLDHAGRI